MDVNAQIGNPDAQAQIDELCRLRQENGLLRQNKLELQMELAQQQYRQEVQEQRIKLAEHRALQMQQKYNVLADSKLGRLTLWIWRFRTAMNAAKVKGDKWFLLRWLLNPTFRKKKEKLTRESKMSQQQLEWINGYMDRVAAVPDSNGCRYYEKYKHRIGLICDEFFYESISDAADFVFITPDNWEKELETGLDVMLFVTAWRGLHEEWRGLGSVPDMDRNPMRQCAVRILEECNGKGIPTVFYSKEDPPNYNVFIEYAKHCAYIRTTAQECVHQYVEDCGHDRVQSVCFGINPVNHNPIGFYRTDKEDCVLFSGSWMLKYPDRCRELSGIFDGILDSSHGLSIVDRNYPGNPKYHFPDKYFPYTSPALPHDLLQKVHKLFDWAVNINSVKDSHTMFANRAFELQANGVLMLSNFSKGVNELLPTVQIVSDSGEVARIMDGMTDEERYERQIAGVRAVMSNHTCFDRLPQLLGAVGLEMEQPVRRILVLCEELTENVQESFHRQSYQDKTLMLAADATEEILTQYAMVAWFAPLAHYGVFYLEDMANGFKYTACDYITKDAWYEGDTLHIGVEHNYVTAMGSKYRTLFWREAFAPSFLLGLSGGMDLENGYSIDRFQFNLVDKPIRKEKRDYLLTLVIPVENNGLHLYAKAFASLKRSSMFRDMEILLIVRETADTKTTGILDELRLKYANVRVLHCPAELKSWNYGISQASAPYVSILSAEAESVGDGYSKLYDAVQNRDLALGNLLRMDVNPDQENYAGQFSEALGGALTENGTEALTRLNWNDILLEGMVIRSDLLRQLQATSRAELLQKLLQHAKSAAAVDETVTVYYKREAQ